jgi:NAD+ kinase
MRVLVIYKKSVYQKQVVDNKSRHLAQLVREHDMSAKKIRVAHEVHNKALRQVEKTLQSLKIPYKSIYRDSPYSIKGYDLIISVGGDGTFLKAAHRAMATPVLGVNSSPQFSVGYFCAATPQTLPQVLKKFLHKPRYRKIQRLKLTVNKKNFPTLIINEILITNSNPAGTSRYILKVGSTQEEHKSSGIWVAPASGSTAAIHSAGGKKLPLQSARYQYVIREPYYQKGQRLKLQRGILSSQEKVTFISKMEGAAFYIDGPHIYQKIKRGDRLVIEQSNQPLLMVY